MSLDLYEIKPTKTVHFFNITNKKTGHEYILRIEESKNINTEPDITIIDTETNEEVINQLWEEIVEEVQTKDF